MNTSYSIKSHLFIFCLAMLSAGVACPQGGFEVGQTAPKIVLDNLVQGRLYVQSYLPVRGSQFIEPTWLPGEMSYLENEYGGLQLSYDIYKDLVILWRQVNQRIQLNSDYITYFKLEDRYFINLIYSPYRESGLEKGFYEVFFADQQTLLVKRAVKVVPEDPGSKFSRADQWFLMKDGQAFELRNKKSLLGAFDDGYHKQIKRFLRSRYIRLQRAGDQEWLTLIGFLNTLSQSD